MFDVQKIRKDFPILNQLVNGHPLVYFDNAATSQTPKQVTDAIVDYYHRYNSNIHRGVHSLSQQATDAYENARKKLQVHFNAKEAQEIIFTSGTTHSINLVASGYTKTLKPGDELLVSAMEHHSNIVPWQFLSQKTGALLKVIPMNQDGSLEVSALDHLLTKKTKVVFIGHVSNAIGTIQPIEYIIRRAHDQNVEVLVDGAQAAPHLQVDVQRLDVDYYTASAHKMCGATGIGILYGKREFLEELPPYQGGGEMISEVTFEKSTYAEIPHKFEAGTPHVSGAVAFGAAIDYLKDMGYENFVPYEEELLNYATEQLKKVNDIIIYGDSINKTPVISFNIKGIHPYDIGSIMDQQGIAVRTGHHCAQPIMDFYQIPGTIRASFSFYNTKQEIDRMIDALLKAI
ncbi:MAG: cysteine desulfurase, partial [Flavobacteriaceae bacterium]|nr:cysteine desulfurase [Flavobacteriaceae bacterium]MCY4268066.1 cysteine desulfurase [Flavobacteriaceae bacterium]